MRYREKMGRKWIVMIIISLVSGIIGWFSMPLIYSLTKSSYDRSGIEGLTD
jgi:hypothetical protein